MYKETYTNNPGKNLGKSPREKLSIDLTCPNLPFAKHILTGFFYEVFKNRKLVERIFYCAPKIMKRFDRFASLAFKHRKRFDRFVLCVPKTEMPKIENFIALKACRMS